MTKRGTDLLMHMLDELVLAKQEVRTTLSGSPEEISLHRVYTQYVDRILDVLKAWAKLRSVDRERLLLDSLSEVVRFLIEHKKIEAARFIGDHLEVIEMRVNEYWKTSETLPTDQENGTSSDNSSKAKSRSSKQSPQKQKSAANNTRKHP